VSMGSTAARKCREIVYNTEHVIAIELLCAAQAMDLFTNMKPGEGTIKAYRLIRDTVPHLEEDRVLSKDIEAVVELMKSGKILEEVETAVGKLQ
jgi:histidine ammonia-lyase